MILWVETKAYGQSDFYLEAKSHVTGEHNLDTTRLEIQGNLSEQMCPSMQCIADYRDKHTSFSPPDIPESTLISYNFEFTLQDNITNADLGPKKKELVEQYGSWILCNVNDIVEENGQELYYCRTEIIGSNIYNTFDDRTWYLNIAGIYDAKNETLKVNGNFTGCGVFRCPY